MCIRPHLMITGELKSKVDSVWNALWSGGVVNPLTAIEQVTYLLFLRRLDELHTLEENKANRAGKPMARRIFGEGNDSGGTPYEDLRWSTLRNEAPAEMFRLVSEHFDHRMFHGFDSDATMLRIGSMNMLMHGVENPDIRRQDSLAQEHQCDVGEYSLVLANPPFAGSLDYETVAKDLLTVVKTKKTELLFLALFLRLLQPGGRAAVIVPDGVLFGSSNAHKSLRKMLIEDQKLDAVIKLPGGVFKPYAGVSTAILLFTKTNSGGTDQVWFYDVQADGWSLDDKRTPLLSDDKLGPVPMTALSAEEHAKNNLPDALARWLARDAAERERPRTAQSFCIPKADIAAQGYDLSLNRYKEVVREEIEHRAPKEILADLAKLEEEIGREMKELEAMLH